ncbi:hypothetical protein E2562_014671 [Oryza meyeriana var. granulata]|uniref:Uncharacterized protein n=1 Tax=Oryza meyeriana var. granulata TaxID=110450 RepID=A0A6G1D3W1_9ORYZ|nr:hypothetical protein E2562_014671 [Oryza meyeriana var. granulata]
MAPSLTARQPASLPSHGKKVVQYHFFSCGGSEKWKIPQSHHLPGVRCSSGSPGSGGDGGTPPLVRAAVSAVTELLRVVSPKNQRDDALQKGAPRGADLDLPRSVDDVVAVLEADYQRAYFLTGNFTPDIYTEDCLFEDPTIKFRGRSRYSQNLDLLVPFFDSPSLELENIKKVTLLAEICQVLVCNDVSAMHVFFFFSFLFAILL